MSFQTCPQERNRVRPAEGRSRSNVSRMRLQHHCPRDSTGIHSRGRQQSGCTGTGPRRRLRQLFPSAHHGRYRPSARKSNALLPQRPPQPPSSPTPQSPPYPSCKLLRAVLGSMSDNRVSRPCRTAEESSAVILSCIFPESVSMPSNRWH